MRADLDWYCILISGHRYCIFITGPLRQGTKTARERNNLLRTELAPTSQRSERIRKKGQGTNFLGGISITFTPILSS